MQGPVRNAPRSWPRRMVAEWLAVCALATALVVALLFTGASARLDNVAYDAALRLSPQPPDPRIAIVAIDDRALAELGAWPWSRRLHARLVDQLTAASAGNIAYDVLFVEPSPEPGADEALGEAIFRNGRVCLPVLTEAPGPNGAAYRIVPPVDVLRRAARGLGHVNLEYDPDGVSRRAALGEGAGGRTMAHLMRCALNPGKPPLPEGGVLERTETALIAYGGRPGRYPAISAASVIRGEIPQAFFRDRYVLVGATASGLHDRHSTPVSIHNEAMAGVEVQANLLDGLLTDRFIRPAPQWASLGVALLLVWTFLAALVAMPPRYNLVLGFAIVTLALGLSIGLLLATRVWLPPSPAVLTLLVVFPLWGWRRLEAASAYLVEELERFAGEPDVLSPGEAPPTRGDVLERQMSLLHLAVQRARDLRAYAARAATQREQMVELLSHDIRSPQSSILAVLDAGEIPTAPAQRIAGYARRTLGLADNFVSLAKAESGALTREVINLSDLVTEALDDLWPMARKAGVRMACEGSEADYLVDGDRSLLTRALINLLDNAIKYSPSGGQVIAILSPVQSGGNDAVRLSICDEGPGVEPERRAGLFRRFERIEGAKAHGIGLGLTLVAEVAHRHGGEVICADQGPGATFVLTLPIYREIKASPIAG